MRVGGDDPLFTCHSRRPGLKRTWSVFAPCAPPKGASHRPRCSAAMPTPYAPRRMVSHHMSLHSPMAPAQLGNNAHTGQPSTSCSQCTGPLRPLFSRSTGCSPGSPPQRVGCTQCGCCDCWALAGVLLIASCVPGWPGSTTGDGAELFTLMVPNPVTLLHLDRRPQRRPDGRLAVASDIRRRRRSAHRDPALRPGHGDQGAGGLRHPLHRLDGCRQRRVSGNEYGPS